MNTENKVTVTNIT